MKSYRLIDLYKRPRIGGIFFSMSKNTQLNSLFSQLGYDNDNSYHSMDFEYIYNHSGLKTVSVAVEQLLKGYIVDDNDDYVILANGKKVTWNYIMNTVDEDIINFIIIQKFLNKWTELIETVKSRFDILSPYSMKYERHTNDKLSSNDTNSANKNTRNNNGGSSEYEGNTNYDSYGFNSTTAVPTDTNTLSNNNSYTNNSEETVTDTRNGEYNRNNELTTTINRSGNIGNKSYQQLIEEQRKMLEWQLYDVIFNDLDSVLTRSKYIL